MLCPTRKTLNVFFGRFSRRVNFQILEKKNWCMNFILKGNVGNSSKM